MINIFVDGQKLFLNPFMSTFADNLIRAIAKSFQPESDASKIELRLKGEELALKLGGESIPLNAGRAQKIVGNVLRGLLSSLHGAETGTEFVFDCERDQQS